LTLFLLLLDYYVIRPILFYYIFDCPNPASGLQYRNKRIVYWIFIGHYKYKGICCGFMLWFGCLV